MLFYLMLLLSVYIYLLLKFQLPENETESKEVATGYNSEWDFLHCIGTMGGKNIQIMQPPHSGSIYFNNKGKFSIVLLALIDAYYQFKYVNVGVQGRISDGGVFNHTQLFEKLINNTLTIPQPTPLPAREMSSPFVIVANDGFPLTKNILKPFPGSHEKGSVERIFNYRLNRTQSVVENVFGLLTAVS
jgi:hypothetical protein